MLLQAMIESGLDSGHVANSHGDYAAADKVFAGAPATPLNDRVCGLLGAESVTMIVPVRLPVEVGVKVQPGR